MRKTKHPVKINKKLALFVARQKNFKIIQIQGVNFAVAEQHLLKRSTSKQKWAIFVKDFGQFYGRFFAAKLTMILGSGQKLVG
jgi:hypothetical protein